MEKKRIIPVVAFKLILITFVLALTTLLIGITGNHPNSPAILTFNTSSLGLDAYHDPAFPLHSNITALVPSGLTTPSSITRYLGAHDWYTIHYFTNCSGFYLPSPTNPSLLTTTKINSTCTRQVSGYTFKLHDAIQSQLLPNVNDLAEYVSTAQHMTSTWSSLWYAGIGNGVIGGFTLPWNFKGKRPGLNWWAFCDAFISTVMFLSSSAMVTNMVITVHHAKGLPGPNPGSAKFLGIMWSTTTLMAVVCVLMWVQWNMEGRRGTQCGAEAIEEWKDEKAVREGQKS